VVYIPTRTISWFSSHWSILRPTPSSVNTSHVPVSLLGGTATDLTAEQIAQQTASQELAQKAAQTAARMALLAAMSAKNEPAAKTKPGARGGSCSASGSPKEPKKRPTSRNQMQKQVDRGQAPKGVDRADNPHVPGQQPHVHYDDGTSSNMDGSTHDAGNGTPNPSQAIRQWLIDNGWTPPRDSRLGDTNGSFWIHEQCPGCGAPLGIARSDFAPDDRGGRCGNRLPARRTDAIRRLLADIR